MVQCPHCSESISLNTRNLDEPHHGVAGESEMMLKSHLGSIFYLVDRATEKLGNSARSHGAGNAHLTLTTDFSSRNRTILLYQIPDESCSEQSPEYLDLRQFVLVSHIEQNSGKDATGTTCWSSDNLPPPAFSSETARA